jgi:hypothetical protein
LGVHTSIWAQPNDAGVNKSVSTGQILKAQQGNCKEHETFGPDQNYFILDQHIPADSRSVEYEEFWDEGMAKA